MDENEPYDRTANQIISAHMRTMVQTGKTKEFSEFSNLTSKFIVVNSSDLFCLSF